MITKDHLEHWLSEIDWQLTGAVKELSKKGYAQKAGLMINGDYFSLEYLREKIQTLTKLRDSIRWDIDHDE
ncbi:MAG: hypothetical protein KAJ19_18275 [Gammaproteobacteria bacterium]|nr:hypothetical protein [Gammaproteobacteria bacterium]